MINLQQLSLRTFDVERGRTRITLQSGDVSSDWLLLGLGHDISRVNAETENFVPT